MMKSVTIVGGKFSKREVNGTFELVRMFEFFNDEAVRNEKGKDGKVTVIMDGTKRGIWVNQDDLQYSEECLPKAVVLSDDEIREKIRNRFDVMGKMGKGIISGTIRSLILSGAPGIGKTHELEKQLTKAQKDQKISYEMVKGKISALGLYIKLYENRDRGCVTVLDDIDVFGDEDVLNILKAALDTGERRFIHWGTASSWLEDKDIPNSFEFTGSVVFITNTNIDKELDRSGKIAPHLQALISRSIYLDLGVHTNRDIMIRVQDVISSTDMLIDRGIKKSEEVELVDWMCEHVDQLRNVSLRTALFIADFIQTDPEWKKIAEATLIKPQ